jgi:GrpB-like predicted nucleotidyltransferase (UPF0157 family)
VFPYDPNWPIQFDRIAAELRPTLFQIPSATIEHVGSTAVPGLAAKPVIDIDIIVDPPDIPAGIAALESIGYTHRGNLGVPGREAFDAADDHPKRNLYLCQRGCLSVRNHLAVRDILRRRPDLRDQYGAVKLALAVDPDMDIDTYVAGKSPILQTILAESDLTSAERTAIFAINNP